jgi:hypothetical protein
VIEVILHIVYQVKNNDLHYLKARKGEVMATVTHNKLPNVSKKVENHLGVCHATSGATLKSVNVGIFRIKKV